MITKPKLPPMKLTICEGEPGDGHYYTAAQMLAIRDAGIAYGIELAAEIAEKDDSDPGSNAVAKSIAAAIRASKEKS